MNSWELEYGERSCLSLSLWVLMGDLSQAGSQ